ncbi:MAG: hypothetical protein JW880_01550 [Candidatus Thermoplasmatota archaeon]|nr:hypothetical protein [Candidatus Thermoplasmatota archaeon]
MGTPPSAKMQAGVLSCAAVFVVLSALALGGAISINGEEALSPVAPVDGPDGSDTEVPLLGFQPVVVGTLDFNPDVVNLRSGGRFVTGYLELPDGYSVREVFVPSVKLNSAVYAETCFGVQTFDTDGDGTEELMLKFVKEDAKATLAPGDWVTVYVSGVMNDGVPFAANDVIAVIGVSR